MSAWGRLTATGSVALAAACVLSSCGNSPTASQKAAVQGILTTTTTTKPPPTVLSQDPPPDGGSSPALRSP